MKWETKSIIDTWKSDDGKVTIWTISNGETEKKTMSAVISKMGWSGEIEEYQNAKGNSYIRQPAKEGWGNTEVAQPATVKELAEPTISLAKGVKERLDRIEKKLDDVLRYITNEQMVAKKEEKLNTSEFKPEDIPVDEEPF